MAFVEIIKTRIQGKLKLAFLHHKTKITPSYTFSLIIPDRVAKKLKFKDGNLYDATNVTLAYDKDLKILLLKSNSNIDGFKVYKSGKKNFKLEFKWTQYIPTENETKRHDVGYYIKNNDLYIML